MKRVFTRYIPIAAGAVWFAFLAYEHVLPNSSDSRRVEVVSNFLERMTSPQRYSYREQTRLRASFESAQYINEHLHPSMIDWHLREWKMTEDEFFKQSVLLTMAFGQKFRVHEMSWDSEKFLYGDSENWDWGLVFIDLKQSLIEATEHVPAGTTFDGCTAFLIFWNSREWYVSPIYTSEHQSMIESSFPEFANLPFQHVQACVSDGLDIN